MTTITKHSADTYTPNKAISSWQHCIALEQFTASEAPHAHTNATEGPMARFGYQGWGYGNFHAQHLYYTLILQEQIWTIDFQVSLICWLHWNKKTWMPGPFEREVWEGDRQLTTQAQFPDKQFHPNDSPIIQCLHGHHDSFPWLIMTLVLRAERRVFARISQIQFEE